MNNVIIVICFLSAFDREETKWISNIAIPKHFLFWSVGTVYFGFFDHAHFIIGQTLDEIL